MPFLNLNWQERFSKSKAGQLRRTHHKSAACKPRSAGFSENKEAWLISNSLWHAHGKSPKAFLVALGLF